MSSAALADPARVFVGIALAAAARTQLAAFLTRVGGLVAAPGWDARLPALDDVHITLRFLGKIARSRLPSLESALAEALSSASDAPVTYGPIEVLPDGASLLPPKHAWLRIGEGAPALAALAVHVDGACVAAGVPIADDAHAFRPHITIARLDRAPDDARSSLLALQPGVVGSTRLGEVTLFESLPRTRPGAAHYTPLARFPLRAQVVDARGSAH